MNVRAELEKIGVDEKNKLFLERIVPNTGPTLGLKTPVVKKLARSLAKENYLEFMNSNLYYYEEKILFGLLFNYIKMSPTDIASHLDRFIPEIDNWAVCDSLIASLKSVNNEKDYFWNYLKKYNSSQKEFESRFVAVMLMTYFAEEKYVPDCLAILDHLYHKEYYSKMGIAWALATFMINFLEPVINLIKDSPNLEGWVKKKAISKAIESYRISEEKKIYLRQIRSTL